MTSAALAIISSICFAGAFVIGKRGLLGTSVVATVLITFGTAWVVTLVAVLVTSAGFPTRIGLGIFTLTGLIAPGIGYAAALVGVDKLGPSISVPIQQGARPVISVSAASVVLEESVGLLRVVGILAIVMGSIGLAMHEPDSNDARQHHGVKNRGRMAGTLRKGLIWPCITAVAFAAFDILVKKGLDVMDEPVLASCITLGSGFLIWALIVASIGSVRSSYVVGPSVRWVGLGGVLFGCASLSVFLALRDGSVSLVSPVMASQPLLVFAFSRLALRDVETVTIGTLWKGALVVIGVLLVVL